MFVDVLRRALELVSECACANEVGCPCCTQHTHCGEYNAVLNKDGAKMVLEAVLHAEKEKNEKNHPGVMPEKRCRLVKKMHC